MTSATQQMLPFEIRLTHEQKSLVRFCAHLTGDTQAAEDLTQETLLIAWRRRTTLTDPAGLTQPTPSTLRLPDTMMHRR